MVSALSFGNRALRVLLVALNTTSSLVENQFYCRDLSGLSNIGLSQIGHLILVALLAMPALGDADAEATTRRNIYVTSEVRLCMLQLKRLENNDVAKYSECCSTHNVDDQECNREKSDIRPDLFGSS